MKFADILLEQYPAPFWKILRQIGVEHAVGVLPRQVSDQRLRRSEAPWEYVPLALYREMIEAEGLTLTALEDSPPMDAIRLGKPGREEEVEQVCKLIRNMGKLAIPVWCYHWMPVLLWIRTSFERGRGGALVIGYDHRLLADAPPALPEPVGEEQLWENLRWFLKRVLPVAEEAGVKLAMHPDDPPLSPIRGIARIMRSPDAFEHLLELVPSDANGITLCQGNFTLMTDDLPSVIRRLGERIFFVHFRDVRGEPTRFVETFHDEGPTDMVACMRAYRDIGFDGVMRSDHVPALEGDNPAVAGLSLLGRLHAIGYMTGLREAVLAEIPEAGGQVAERALR
jgi:mannonate dehydratase